MVQQANNSCKLTINFTIQNKRILFLKNCCVQTNGQIIRNKRIVWSNDQIKINMRIIFLKKYRIVGFCNTTVYQLLQITVTQNTNTNFSLPFVLDNTDKSLVTTLCYFKAHQNVILASSRTTVCFYSNILNFLQLVFIEVWTLLEIDISIN